MVPPLVFFVLSQPHDLDLVRNAQRMMSFPMNWQYVTDREEAISYLLGRGRYADRTAHPLPSLVVADADFVNVSPSSFLKKLAADQMSKPPFVCMLLTEDSLSVCTETLIAGADAVHAKPRDEQGWSDLLQRLTTFFCMNSKNVRF